MTASMSGTIANKGTSSASYQNADIDSLLGLTCLAYNTSKSALLQMARSAAAEWGAHGLRVNVSRQQLEPFG
jgi:NAD(P)-dependent dehydrogenase (short-subunit alcohol dehydrogenase family)